MQKPKTKNQNDNLKIKKNFDKALIWLYILLVCGLVGVVDASYLTWEHYRAVLPPCHVTWMTQILGTWVDCGRVLTSQWAQIGPIPTAALGLVFYLGIVGWAVIEILKKSMEGMESTKSTKRNLKNGNWKLVMEIGKWKLVNNYSIEDLVNSKWWYRLLALMAVAGIMTSSFLVYLMLVVIKSICLYCLLSAVNTGVIAYSAYRITQQQLMVAQKIQTKTREEN